MVIHPLIIEITLYYFMDFIFDPNLLFLNNYELEKNDH